MKKIYFTLLFLSIFLFGKAQPVTFNRQILYPPHQYDFTLEINSLQQTKDKGYITRRGVYDTVNSVLQGYCELIKTDSAGSTQWVKRIPVGVFANANLTIGLTVIQAADEGYLVGVSLCDGTQKVKLTLIKTDSLANVIWSRQYNGEGASAVYCLKQTIDKGYIVCGATKNPANKQYGYIFKTDSLGNCTWKKNCVLGSDTLAAFYSVLELPHVGYVVAGYSGSKALVTKLDLNGNLIWDKDLFKKGASFYSVIKTSDNAFVVSGSFTDTVNFQPCLFFAKFDTMGNMLWLKGYSQLPAQYYGSYIWSSVAVANNIVFAAYVSDPIPASLIGKLDLNGNLIWCNEYRYTFHTFNYTPNTIIKTNDGGFAFTTLVGILGVSSYAKVFLKTDSLGKLGCDGFSYPIPITNLAYTPTSNAVVSISGSSVSYVPVSSSNSMVDDTAYCETPAYLSIKQISANNYQVNVYPNPSSGIINLQMSNYENATVEVYSVIGQKVYTQQMQNNLQQLNLSSVADGVYQLRVMKNNTSVFQTKIIKQ